MPLDQTPAFDPAVILGHITAATELLLTSAGSLGDADMRAPSLLPGWSRGHVLTHVARNADGGTRLLTWARTGVETYEYPSMAARAAEIQAGAGRAAAELVADVRESAGRFAAAYRAMPAEAWKHVVRWTGGQEHPAERAADSRLCEVLVHHVDLRAGFTPDGWPPYFATDMLGRVVRSFANRAAAPALRLYATDTGASYQVAAGDGTPEIRGSQIALLAWLMGRSTGHGLTIDGGAPLPDLPFLY